RCRRSRRGDQVSHLVDVDDPPDRQQIEHDGQKAGEYREPRNVAAPGWGWRLVVLDHADHDSSRIAVRFAASAAARAGCASDQLSASGIVRRAVGPRTSVTAGWIPA